MTAAMQMDSTVRLPAEIRRAADRRLVSAMPALTLIPMTGASRRPDFCVILSA